MNDKFQTLIQESLALPSPVLNGDSVLVYGAGNKGREIARFLSGRGYVVSGFLDTNAKPGQHIGRIPVVTLNDWLRDNEPERHSIVVAIHNYTVEMPPLLDSIRAQGFKQVFNIVEFYNAFPKALPDHYWLTAKACYTPFGDPLDRLHRVLADEKSREWLEAVVRFRLSGNYTLLPKTQLGDQYRPGDLPMWPQSLRFIDCGAFDGDTLEHLRQGGYSFDAIAAFEPDPGNFRKLAEAVRRHGEAICFPCALGAQTESLRFNADASMASQISSTGDQTIQCVTLDEALPNFRPNLIKMDIEGAELEALLGARRIISEHRPGLAISLYHTPGHLWQIPLLLHDWGLGYRFHIRGHAHNSYELVLYAIPSNIPGESIR